MCDAPSDVEVPQGKNIGSLKLKEHEHVYTPRSKTLNFDQPLHKFVIFELVERIASEQALLSSLLL